MSQSGGSVEPDALWLGVGTSKLLKSQKGSSDLGGQRASRG